MSVKLKPSRGKYEVRWREGGRAHSRLFERKGDADAFDLELRRRKQLGAIAGTVLQSKVTLAEFVEEEWWPRYAIPNLAPSTRERYLSAWAVHLLPRLGGYELRELTPMLVEDLRAELERAGVGAPTVRKSMLLLQGILERARARGLIPQNPVAAVKKPKKAPTRSPQPLSPLSVERIRALMLAPTRIVPASGRGQRFRREHEIPNGTLHWRQRNALIVSMLAYAGLRPIEDRSSHWEDVHQRTMHVFASKTNRARDVDLLAPLAQDLAEWRMACGRPGDERLIIPRSRGVGEWCKGDWDNWRTRIWRPAAIAAGVTGDMRPYRLRGSFVSLLLWEGRSLPYVADQAGHSVATLATHYAGVIRELEDEERVPAAEAIRQAREQLASESCATIVRQTAERRS